MIKVENQDSMIFPEKSFFQICANPGGHNTVMPEGARTRGIEPMPYLLFLKKQQNLKLSSAAIIGGAL